MPAESVSRERERERVLGTRSVADRRARRRSWLLVAAIVLLAFNLRPAVTGLGAVLDEVTASLRLTPTFAGVLTTLPVLCFAVVGALAAPLGRRFGVERVLAGSLLIVVVGSAIRAGTDSAPVFVAATGLTLAAMATGNVLIPACVKANFPDRIGAMTAAYTTVLAVGTTTPAASTVPIGEAFGTWRAGLATWGLTAAVAAIPWLVLAFDRRRAATGPPRGGTGGRTGGRTGGGTGLARSPVAWALALYFGLQATQAYAAFGWLAQIFKDAGVDAVTAGLLLSVLPVAGIPVALAIPTIASRLPNPWVLVLVCGACYLAGYAGLMIAPVSGGFVWVLLLGLGGGSFPLALTLIGMRARHAETTARLSGFVQSTGYVLAAIGPLAIGALYGATGGWTAPIGLLALLVVPQMIAGVIAARPRYVDDDR